MVLFRDINKASKDIFTKDYPDGKPWDIEHKSQINNPQLTLNASMSPNGALTKSTTVKYTVNNCIGEMKLNSEGLITGDLKYKIPQIAGITIGGKYDFKVKTAPMDSVQFSTEYASSKLHGKAIINPFNGKFSCEGCFGANFNGSYLVGGEISGVIPEFKANYSCGAAYTYTNQSYEWGASLVSAPQGGANFGKLILHLRGKAMLNQQPSQLCAELQRSLVDGTVSISYATQYSLNDKGTTIFKGKVMDDGKVSVALSHKFSNSLTAAVGTQIDGFNTSSESVKYGIKINSSS